MEKVVSKLTHLCSAGKTLTMVHGFCIFRAITLKVYAYITLKVYACTVGHHLTLLPSPYLSATKYIHYKLTARIHTHMNTLYMHTCMQSWARFNTLHIMQTHTCTPHTALNQAGRHMEDSILAAYAALLLGILAKHHHVSTCINIFFTVG